MGATWRSTAEFGWSKPRHLHELRGGRPYRTFPPGIPIDWHSPEVERTFDVAASTVTFTRGYKVATEPILQLGIDRPTLGIEVWDGEVPPPSAAAPAPQTTPPAETVSDTDLKACILAIQRDRPDDPPDEETLWAAVEDRLKAKVGRDRVRNARKKVAPKWVNPVGRPRTRQ
jgi:hypothetical protein